MTQRTASRSGFARALCTLGSASLTFAILQTPAKAGGDITNFNLKNCASERIFVCSFDKTDSLMKIPYKAAGVQPGDRKEFGCASIGRCKVIIGVSKRKTKKTLSSGMETALTAGSATGAGVAGASAGLFYTVGMGVMNTSVAAVTIVGAGAVGAFVAIGAGAAIASIEIADGWSDGEVCNQVRKAAQKAGLSPKFFLQDGKKYRLIEKYAVDKDGNQYVNPDGTAVITYDVTTKLNACPAPLAKQIVKN
jgi:hypothetical protein